MSDFVIDTNKLTKQYGFLFWKKKVAALDQLTIQVPKGAVFGFLGPNGAGKTTLMKMLVDILDPSSGEVLLDGVNI
ncbi:MAG: ATP-binding cassette domain-containing protein, partial [Lentisphaeria bacterium]|nr:ATP-binding cassette domain-containing protein [Lentisphaeria bacterium]